jgi:hypothetical protein
MAPRLQRAAFGAAAALVVAGGVCAALVHGIVGEVLTIVLISTGLCGALLLVFLEIGFGEERDLAREEERKRTRVRALTLRRRSRPARRRRPE